MKKLLNVLLILAVVVTNLIPASVLAAARTGSIEITRAATNAEVTYNAYKVFDLKYSENNNNKSYNYTVNAEWLNFFNIDVTTDAGSFKNPIDNKFITYYVSRGEAIVVSVKDEDPKALAEAAIAYAKDNKVTPAGTTTAKSETKVTIDGLELGYYLVDSTLGALVHLDTTDYTASIKEKNEEPTPEKEVSEVTTEVGKELTYTITVPVEKGAIGYEVSDKMSKGLTLKATPSVTVDGNTVAAENYKYTLGTAKGNGNAVTFTIKFADEYVATIYEKNIVITYNAIVNEEAVIIDEVNNEATLKYGDGNSVDFTSPVTDLYDLTVRKTDESGSALTGAIFSLYRSEDSNEAIELVFENGYYRPATAEDRNTTTSIVAGVATVKGLAKATYWLQEDVAPEGYNKLANRIKVAVGSSNDSKVLYKDVINTTGAILPSTGGMGTILFITVGSIMALGFGVNLVTKARMRKIED